MRIRREWRQSRGRDKDWGFFCLISNNYRIVLQCCDIDIFVWYAWVCVCVCVICAAVCVCVCVSAFWSTWGSPALDLKYRDMTNIICWVITICQSVWQTSARRYRLHYFGPRCFPYNKVSSKLLLHSSRPESNNHLGLMQQTKPVNFLISQKSDLIWTFKNANPASNTHMQGNLKSIICCQSDIWAI